MTIEELQAMLAKLTVALQPEDEPALVFVLEDDAG